MATSPLISKNISILYRYGKMFMTQRLKTCGIGPGQHGLILSVIREPGIRQDQLAVNFGMDKGTITRLVQKLEKKGFLRRESLARDRRVNCLYPTVKAFEVQAVIQEKAMEWYNVILEDLLPEECETVARLLAQMSKNAVEYMKCPREPMEKKRSKED